jgi:hypothetical protein
VEAKFKMNNSDRNTNDEEAAERNPRLWGIIYIIIGVDGLVFSIYALLDSLGMVPLYGTVTAGILIGLMSILIIMFGYKVLRKNY